MPQEAGWLGPWGKTREGQAAQRDPETHVALRSQLSLAAEWLGLQESQLKGLEEAGAETPSVGRAPALPARGETSSFWRLGSAAQKGLPSQQG